MKTDWLPLQINYSNLFVYVLFQSFIISTLGVLCVAVELVVIMVDMFVYILESG